MLEVAEVQATTPEAVMVVLAAVVLVIHVQVQEVKAEADLLEMLDKMVDIIVEAQMVLL
jgi:hypothetical protein